MNNQEEESSETKTTSENSEIQTTDENSTLNNDEKIEKSNENEKSCSSPENKISNEQEPTRRIIMSQDIRYSTEQGDRDKLMEKYNNYQVSDTNSCNIRFLTDHRQKKILFGRSEGTNLRNSFFFLFGFFFIEENSNLHSISKTFNVNMLVRIYILFLFNIYLFFFLSRVIKILQNIHLKFLVQKLMYENVLLKLLIGCLNSKIEQQLKVIAKIIINKQVQLMSKNLMKQKFQLVNFINKKLLMNLNFSFLDNEKSDDKSSPQPTSIFVTTINPDSSVSEEKKSIIPSISNDNEEKSDTKDENIEEGQYKFIPLERKPEYTFIILITSQGQEVLKSINFLLIYFIF
jgi:hypothetical protein